MRITLGILVGLSLALIGCATKGGPQSYGYGGYGAEPNPCADCISNRQSPPYHGAK